MEASHPAAPSPSPELFDRLVGVLLDTVEGDEPGPPTLVHVADDPSSDDGFRLGLLPSPGDPYETLLGFNAPGDWMAMGMLTGGWTYPPDIAEHVDFERGRFLVVPPSQHPRRLRVRTAYLCTRDGATYGHTKVSDGRAVDEAPSSGRMVDAFRRVFGLPTEPPSIGVAELFTLRWLVSIAGVAQLEGRALPWAEAAALHDGVSLLDLAPEDFEAATGALHRVATWEQLRQGTAEGHGLAPMVDPDHAAWMDEGMFCREIVGRYPSVAILLDMLSDAVSARTARRVREIIRGWGIDTSPWAA
jgi:hypothetical protein